MSKTKNKKMSFILFFTLSFFIFICALSGCGIKDNSLNVTGISIITPAKQTTYLINEPVNPKGLTIQVEYKDGSKEVMAVTKAMIRNAKSGTSAGSGTVKVYFAGFEDSFQIYTTSNQVYYLQTLLDISIGTMTNEENYNLDVSIANSKVLVRKNNNTHYVEALGNKYWFIENIIYKQSANGNKLILTDKTEIAQITKYFLSNSIIKNMLNLYNAIIDNSIDDDLIVFENFKIDFSMDGTKTIKAAYTSSQIPSAEFNIKITEQNWVTYYQYKIEDGNLTTASVDYGSFNIPTLPGNIEDYI